VRAVRARVFPRRQGRSSRARSTDRALEGVVGRGRAAGRRQQGPAPLERPSARWTAVRAGTARWKVKIILDGEGGARKPEPGKRSPGPHASRLAADVLIGSDGPKQEKRADAREWGAWPPRRQHRRRQRPVGFAPLRQLRQRRGRIRSFRLRGLIADIEERRRAWASEHENVPAGRRARSFAKWEDKAVWTPFLRPHGQHQPLHDRRPPRRTLRRTHHPADGPRAPWTSGLTPDTPLAAMPRARPSGPSPEHQSRTAGWSRSRPQADGPNPPATPRPRVPEFGWLLRLLEEARWTRSPVRAADSGRHPSRSTSHRCPATYPACGFRPPTATISSTTSNRALRAPALSTAQTALYAAIVSSRPM